MALRGLALGIELQQFVGHVLHGLLYAAFVLAHGCGAEVVEHRLRAFRRTILLHQVEPRERNIQPRAFGELQQHELRGAVALIDFLQPLVLPDAVLDVDHVIADLQIAEVGEKRRDLRLLPLRPGQRRFGFVEQIACAEDHEVRSGTTTPSGT